MYVYCTMDFRHWQEGVNGTIFTANMATAADFVGTNTQCFRQDCELMCGFIFQQWPIGNTRHGDREHSEDRTALHEPQHD